jgi:hypothetical protein
MPLKVVGRKIVMHMDLVITGVNKPVSIPSVGLVRAARRPILAAR